MKNILYFLKLKFITFIRQNMWSDYGDDELQIHWDNYRNHLSHNQDDIEFCEEYNQLVYEIKYRRLNFE
jgi:hypothetical protein